MLPVSFIARGVDTVGESLSVDSPPVSAMIRTVKVLSLSNSHISNRSKSPGPDEKSSAHFHVPIIRALQIYRHFWHARLEILYTFAFPGIGAHSLMPDNVIQNLLGL
jgi:hypothetical protein